MKRAAVSLVFIVGCRFDLPTVGIDATVGTSGDARRIDASGIDAMPVDGPVDAPVGDLGCPGFTPLPGGPPGHVYLKAPGIAPWSTQFNFCKSLSSRAYLAVPNDATELMNLYALAGTSLWAGINDRMTEGVYVSAETGGPAAFLPWDSGEPDHSTGDGDCVVAWHPMIFDESCNASAWAYCECNP